MGSIPITVRLVSSWTFSKYAPILASFLAAFNLNKIVDEMGRDWKLVIQWRSQ